MPHWDGDKPATRPPGPGSLREGDIPGLSDLGAEQDSEPGTREPTEWETGAEGTLPLGEVLPGISKIKGPEVSAIPLLFDGKLQPNSQTTARGLRESEEEGAR